MTHGLVLGKFMPPHTGHKFLVDFGASYCDDLSVLVCSIANEPIPGKLRYNWMRESFPNVNVSHLTEELPQEPSENPNFWSLWKSAIKRTVPQPIDYVFASENYGARLAQELDAKFIAVDLARAQVPISGTAIRADPYGNWDAILPAARPYFTKRVCIYGPESTGKTTLTKYLTKKFETVGALEYARALLDPKDGRVDIIDITNIARGQAATEDALIKQANKVFFTDTDALTTSIWSNVLFNTVPPEVKTLATERKYDLYLLLDVDVPWVNDNQRYLPHRRTEFFERCRRELESRGRPYTIIRGSWKERYATAERAVTELLYPPQPGKTPHAARSVQQQEAAA